MVGLQKISDWSDSPCVVAASGPSLTREAAENIRRAQFRGWKVIAVNDAYKLLRGADILYAADLRWWRSQDGAKAFLGERWCCKDYLEPPDAERIADARRFNLSLIGVKFSAGFSTNPDYLHTGDEAHSGFQAVNLALLLGSPRVVLIGYDMRTVDGQSHFFGDHPEGLRSWFQKAHPDKYYASWVRAYKPDARIVNATPGSAITCYERQDLDEALRWNDRVHRDGTLADAGADRHSAA